MADEQQENLAPPVEEFVELHSLSGVEAGGSEHPEACHPEVWGGEVA